jgi:hypothetical protein
MKSLQSCDTFSSICYIFIIDSFGEIYIFKNCNTILFKCCNLLWAMNGCLKDSILV